LDYAVRSGWTPRADSERVSSGEPKRSEVNGADRSRWLTRRGSRATEHGLLDSRILLLGVGFNRCTALHFAESLVAKRRTMTVRFPRLDGVRPEWVEVANIANDLNTHFPIIGAQYLAAKRAAEGTVGEAAAVYFRMRDLVDVAREYFERVL